MVMVNTVKNNVKQKGEPMLSLFLCAALYPGTASSYGSIQNPLPFLPALSWPAVTFLH